MPPARFLPPAARPDTLERARLVDALHAGAGRRLQIVIAPPGFGKTTLLAEFARDLDPPPAWVTLDEGDSDLATFVSALVEALQRPAPGFGSRTLAALAGTPDIERRAATIARAFTTEAAERFEAPVILVLDDFQQVNGSTPVTGFLDDVLRLLPDNLRIVLAGRSLPNLTVSRLIVAGELFGLGEADLRFTADELRTLLRRHGADIPHDQASALAERAEGWVAGFLLSVPDLLHGLAGSIFTAGGGDGELYRYLAAEAFDRQPEHVRRFLLATAVPDLPDLELCRAMLGEGDWEEARDAVEGAGLFLTRAGRAAFRYHQLFREFLLDRLRRQQPGHARHYHAAIAPLLAARGEWQRAASAYLEAGNVPAAVAITAAALPEMERTGRWRTITAAVAALPVAAATAEPEMLVTGARAALMTSEFARAETLAQALRAAGERTGDHRAEAWGLACLGNVRRLQGRAPEARELLEQAIARAGHDEEITAAARRYLGTALGMAGDFTAAAEHLRAALEIFDRHHRAFDAALSEWPLGIVLARAGRVPEAIARYRSALARWQALGDPGNTAELENCLGAAHAGRGEYALAEPYLRAALGHAREAGYAKAEGAAQHTLGEVLLAQGDAAGARSAFSQGLAVMQETGDLWMVTQLHEGLALAALLAGDVTAAREQAHHATALAQRQGLPYLEGRCGLTLGYALARAGDPEGRPRLDAALAEMERQGAQRELATGLLFRAALALAEGQDWSAPLRQALAIVDALGASALLDLHVRLEPRLFQTAVPSVLSPERLAVLRARAGGRVLPVDAPGFADLPALEVRAFGPGTVLMDGGPARFTWEKSRELFFYLLLEGARRQEQVAAALWPDAPPARARRDVHSAVFRLRRALHLDAVLRHDASLRLNDELITTCDVRTYQRLARQAMEERGSAAIDLLERAVVLYTGPLLDGCAAEWAELERGRMERLQITLLTRLATEYAAAGQPRESVSAGERALVMDPLNEDACATVIRGYLRLRDPVAARAAYDRCAAALAADLDVCPGPELTALARRIGRVRTER